MAMLIDMLFVRFLSFQDLYFENIAIDGQLMHGWIDLSEIVPLPNNSSIIIMGKMSSHIVKKINEFEAAVDKILNDD